MVERAWRAEDACAVDLQDSDGARLAGATRRFACSIVPNREDTIYRSKAVGEPPLMLAISVFHAIRDAVASCGARRLPAGPDGAGDTGSGAACDRRRAEEDGRMNRHCWHRAVDLPRRRWLQPLHDWPAAVLRAAADARACVARIVVASVRGSAPREAGTCMLIGDHEATSARSAVVNSNGQRSQLRDSMLATSRALRVSVHRFVLGHATLAQCCGGVVELWIERYTRADLPFLERAACCIAPRRTADRARLTAAGIERAHRGFVVAASSERVRAESQRRRRSCCEESLDEHVAVVVAVRRRSCRPGTGARARRRCRCRLAGSIRVAELLPHGISAVPCRSCTPPSRC